MKCYAVCDIQSGAIRYSGQSLGLAALALKPGTTYAIGDSVDNARANAEINASKFRVGEGDRAK